MTSCTIVLMQNYVFISKLHIPDDETKMKSVPFFWFLYRSDDVGTIAPYQLSSLAVLFISLPKPYGRLSTAK